jgi:hypothetical protein
LAEGYLVPLGGLQLDPDHGRFDPLTLTAPFHRGRACLEKIDAAGIEQLAALIAGLAYWSRGADGETVRCGLALDRTRHEEIAEGWAAVLTPVGPGVLLWTNCD